MEAIRNSLIMREMNKIIDGGPNDVHFTFSAELYAGDQKVNLHRVDFINIAGDYGNNYQDEVTACFKIEPSVYMKVVYPNRNNLEIHLRRTPLAEEGQKIAGIGVTLEKLRAYLINPVNLTAHQNIEVSDKGLDMMGFMDLPVQMTDPFANKVRLHQCGINYRAKTPAEALLASLTRAIKENPVNGRAIPAKIDMIDPDNTTKREHIVVDHGKLMSTMPHYLQDKQGGIYNAGIRMYYRRGMFFIWPKYYLGDKVGQRKLLTIFNVPANQFPGAERTYRVTDYQVLIISTGESRETDVTMDLELNEGNGIRFTDANAILDGMVVGEGNRSIARRGFANSEFIDGETGRAENFAPVSRNRITSNAFAEVSRLSARKGTIQQFVWQNADPYILDPGMGVKVISLKEGRLIEQMGSLAGGEYHMGPKVNNFINNQLTITGGLSVFVAKEFRVIG